MNTSLLLSLYASVGFVEWALALLRTVFVIKYERERKPHQLAVVAATVALETFVGMVVFANYANSRDLLIAAAYSVGSALGSLLPMWFMCKKGSQHGHEISG